MRQADKFIYDRVKYTHNQTFLKNIVNKNPKVNLKILALTKIKDQVFIYDLILSTKSSSVRYEAARQLTDESLQEQVLKKTLYGNETLLGIFIERIFDNDPIILGYLKRHRDESLWDLSLPKLKKRKVLVELQKYYGNKEHDALYEIEGIRVKLKDRLAELPKSVDFITRGD